MKFVTLALLALIASPAFAQTINNLPSPSWSITPNYGNTQTIATRYTKDAQGNVIDAKTYRGNSQFIYFGECSKPDGATYHCDILVETSVVLVASDGSTAVINLTIQSSSVLIRSGHNYWRHSDIVTSGDVTTP